MWNTRSAVVIVATAMLAGLTGCANATDSPHVRILGPWPEGEPEAQQFRAALDAFEHDHDVEVDYIGSPAVNQVLRSELQKGAPPDIAVLPSPGDLVTYQNELTPLEDIVGTTWTGEYTRQWQELSKVGLPHLLAVPIRVDLKGLVWFNREHPPAWEPRTLAELSTLSGDLVAAGQTPWCLGVAAQTTSGWPGTDWIESILLKQSGVDVYKQWAAGRLPWNSRQVRQAWTTWGSLVTEPGQVFGGPKAALLTEFGDAAKPMFAERPRCLMEHQASFMAVPYYGEYGQKPVPGRDFDFFPLPPATELPADADPKPVSANIAGIFRDSAQTQALIRFLISTSAQERWPAARAFSANSRVPAARYDDEASREIAETLTGPAPLCFDASDLMPSIMRGVFYRAVLEYLSEPGRLETLLTELEQVREDVTPEKWVDVACGQ